MKTLFTIVILILAFSCGAPLGPAPDAWRILVRYPDYGVFNVEGIAADGEVVFFLRAYEDAAPVIIRYSKGALAVVFTVDLKGADGASINDIAINNGTGWAVGARDYSSTGSGVKSLLIHYNGLTWREIEISGAGRDLAFHAVAPVNKDSCWLLISRDFYPRRGPLTLGKFDDGALLEYPDVKAETVVYDRDAGTTFGLVIKNGVNILVSADGGDTWFEEKLAMENNWRDLETDDIAAYAAKGVLYIAANDTEGDPTAGTVFYRRGGSPGEGEYELLLYCPLGPNFVNVESIAVDDRDRIVAVGRWTSVYFDTSIWVQEYLPARVHIYDVTPGARGFFAVGKDENFNFELLYHP